MGKFLRARKVPGTSEPLFMISQGTGVDTEQRHFAAAVRHMGSLDLSQPQPESVVSYLGVLIKRIVLYEPLFAQNNGLPMPLNMQKTAELAQHVCDHRITVEQEVGVW